MLDATFKVNNIQLLLFMLAAVDADGHGQPVAHALLAREDESHIQLLLRDVQQWNADITSSTFITDSDLAEINVIRAICPSADIFLCRFHVMKAFTEINRQSVENGETLLNVSCISELH